MSDTSLLLAMLAVPLAGAVLTWALRRAAAIYLVTAFSHLAVLGLGLSLLALLLTGHQPRGLGGWLYLDHLGGLVLLTVVCVSFLAAVYSIGYLREEVREGVVRPAELRRYFALTHVFVFTMLATSVAGNLGLLWTAIAATTVASAPLVDFYGSAEPLEAAWKYILLTTAGSMVALVGFLVIYQAGVGVLGGSYDFSFTRLLAVAGHLSPTLAFTGFLLALVGLGTKAGLAPMHSWLPDAYSQAPSPVCALLSGAEINCALLGILRVYQVAAPAVGAGRLRAELLAFGLFSVLIGVIFLVTQRDFKRLLAYSSIENLGLITVGLAIGGPLSVFGAFLQLVNHAFAKALMFFGTGNLLLRYRTQSVAGVTGAMRLAPITAVAVLLGVLALAGAPPFGPFISELSIITGAFAVRQWLPGFLTPALLLVGFIGLVWPFNRMLFSPPPKDGEGVAVIGPIVLAPVYIALAILVLLGFWIPGPLHDLLIGATRAFRS